MTDKQHILGIDIGTTSVKVCIVCAGAGNDTVEVVAQHSKDTGAQTPSDRGPQGNKQDVSTIVSAVNLCVSKLPKSLLQKVIKIGICGQMHGVMFWKNEGCDKAWDLVEKDSGRARFDVITDRVSALYTWQDNRCDQAFLAKLPTPKSHSKISTGFGNATIFWMAINKPEKLKKYNCSGTIMDFCVAMLCNLDKPVISNQNAASWGYFDCSDNTWNDSSVLCDSDFPVRLLPTVKKVGEIAGHLIVDWHSIPKGTPITVACGDIQCSVLSTLESSSDAVLNVSTSAQITFIAESYVPHSGPPEESPVAYFPYFQDRFIAIGASLNGGNALATFVKMLQQWTQDLGFNVPQSKVWEKVLSLGEDDNSVSDLEIVPTCLGERHAPDATASVANIHVGNLGLGQVFRALCKGLIQNLHTMMPKKILQDAQISRIVGNGSGLSRNAVLQKEVQRQYELPLVFTKGGDAAKGAAMAAVLFSE